MISGWRKAFAQPDMWFGFVQIAGYAYSHPYPGGCEVDHSHAAGDLRQAQLAALALPRVGFTTAVDTGDWSNIHPPDKQNPSARLARQALVQAYGLREPAPADEFPVYSGSSATIDAATSKAVVTVHIRGSLSNKPIKLTASAPKAATQSTTLGQGTSVPRNMCVDALLKGPLPCDCGYPTIYGEFGNGTKVMLNATAVIGDDGSSIIMTSIETVGGEVLEGGGAGDGGGGGGGGDGSSGFVLTASSYGRASWPMTLFFAQEGGNPVIPWYSNFTNVKPWAWPL